MNAAVLRALEFDRIREALASQALTPLGRARASALEPSTDADAVRRALALTAEAHAFVRGGGTLGLWAPEDLLAILDSLSIAERALEPMALLGLARFLASVQSVASGLRSRIGEASPSPLQLIARQTAAFEEETRAVSRAIEPSGDVSDNASSALRDIRDKLRRQRAKLRSTLEGLTRGRETSKYLQDQIVTDRNGRYVLVVRAEHRESLPGIVHGTSASGASLYLEPLSTLPLNNDVVALVEREREEIHRILLALTDAFRRRSDELEATVDVAAIVDELYAKAELATRVDGIAPEVVDDGRIEFRAARHPLLIPAVRDLLEKGENDAPGRVVVASDLLVVPPTRALVISGPNTGGKTVALKAIGLLSLMVQAGLLIPVEPGSRCTPFKCVFADIGDEQSISASLSTFSAHIANIVAMERALELPALVLLDEVGGGTDPIEGGALGTSVIDHFQRRGATVVATTHDDALKSYAATTEGVQTAAFGFIPETYAPTYRLIYGAPGRSLALEIAERLGMPASVIAAARARRSTRESQLAEHLARVDRELAALDAEREATRRRAAELDEERRALLARESRLTEREAVLKRRMDDKLNDRLREARLEVDKIVADLKGQAGALVQKADRRDRLTTGDIGGLRAEARAALDSIGDRHDVAAAPVDAEAGTFDEAPDDGTRVLVSTFGGAEGIVRGVSGKQIDVEVRGKRMRVALKDLRRIGAAPQAKTPVQQGSYSKPPSLQASRSGQPLVAITRDLVVVGSTVDDAIDRVEKFLDDALLRDERRLRIVHGHGTGRLRDALREHFKKHPLVTSVTPAADNEGGGAATIVELKE